MLEILISLNKLPAKKYIFDADVSLLDIRGKIAVEFNCHLTQVKIYDNNTTPHRNKIIECTVNNYTRDSIDHDKVSDLIYVMNKYNHKFPNLILKVSLEYWKSSDRYSDKFLAEDRAPIVLTDKTFDVKTTKSEFLDIVRREMIMKNSDIISSDHQVTFIGCRDLKRLESDIPIVNILMASSQVKVFFQLVPNSYRKLAYSISIEAAPAKEYMYRLNTEKLSDVIQDMFYDNNRAYCKSYGIIKPNRIAVFSKDGEIIPHSEPVSRLPEEVKFIILPEITRVSEFNLNSFTENKGIHDLTISITANEKILLSYDVLSAFFILYSDTEASLFRIWFKNRKNFSDKNEIKIDILKSPFISFPEDSNIKAAKFIINYVYQSIEFQNIVDIIPCVSMWADYFGFSKLITEINEINDIIESESERARKRIKH